MKINVLSLFDGISCGQVALERAGIKVHNYFASEIDPYAIKITQKNYPNTIQLGDVSLWKKWNLPTIDLILAGSPCQGFSVAGRQLNFDDPRSKLFFEFIDILNYYKPKYFLLENVKMKKEWRDIMTSYVGVEPILINSSLVSAQNRNRYYWTNIPNITQPEDKHIYLKDILLEDVPITFTEARTENAKEIRRKVRKETGKDYSPRRDKIVVPRLDGKANCVTTAPTIENMILSKKGLDYMNRQVSDGRTHWDFKHFSDIENDKSSAVVANFFKGVPYNVLKDRNCVRKFHPIECERLQTLEDNYTEGISNTNRYKCIGNGWTVDVIAHILKNVPTS